MAASRSGGITKGTMGQSKRQAQVFEVLVASSSSSSSNAAAAAVVAAAAAKRKKMGLDNQKEGAADVAEEGEDDNEDQNDDEEQEEQEEVLEGDVLVDCTGNFGQRKWLGPGGRPAIGERSANVRIHSSVPDVSSYICVFISTSCVVLVLWERTHAWIFNFLA